MTVAYGRDDDNYSLLFDVDPTVVFGTVSTFVGF